MTKKTLEIHSENILPIIKKWLYSDKDIFVRELVANACDAVQKVKILRDQGQTVANDDEFRIDIQVDKNARTITFTDTGIGMDAAEVEKYIAQIAFSSAEEFLDKYKTNKETDQIIGHFGLGFYSAYIAAENVEIDTLSYKEGSKPVSWKCDGSPTYEIGDGKRDQRGTKITLHVGEEGAEFLDEHRLQEILDRYCAFLPVPIYLGDRRINEEEPLWIKSASECTENDYLTFYRHLYPMEADPLFWVHLNVDYPFHLKGILYFPKLKPNFERDSSTVQLYCNRVFVADNCKDVLPKYLTVLRGVIDSPDIPLNVSRSYLQVDRTVRQLGNHISKKVSDSLATLYRTDRDKFIQTWADVSNIIKIGAIEDDKFYERVKEILIWKNTRGEWTTVEEYLKGNQTENKIMYTRDPNHGAALLEMYHEKGIEVLCADSPIDSYLIHFLEPKISPATFQRIDSAVEDHLLDKEKEKTVLDAEGRTEAGKLADFVRKQLNNEQIEVEAKSLARSSLPGIVMVKEEQRRMRDYMLALSPNQQAIPMMQTFVVNTNSPLINSIQQLSQKKPDLAKDMIQQVYEMALLSQREMDPKTLNNFLTRNQTVMEKLAEVCANL